MNYGVLVILLALVLFFGIILSITIGRRNGLRLKRKDPGTNSGIIPIEGALFGLLGLLIAFTFSGAVQRFDTRRHLITEEANDIGTAYLRVDLLPASVQPEMRDLFRDYLDMRLLTYKNAATPKLAMENFEQSVKLQGKIWALAAQASQNSPSYVPMLLLPAINAMIDITTTRLMATKMHPPIIIFFLLYVLTLGCGFLAGNAMTDGKTRYWAHTIGFAAIMSVTIYLIFDIEYPRLGFIRVDAADQVLVQLRESMN